MAQKVVTTYTDDLTGEESAEISTHTVLVDGAGVELDLTPENHDKLLEALRPFLNAPGARRARGATGARRRPVSRLSGSGDTAKVRAWAKENGYDVNNRGRVPASVREAYEKAE
jgi:hypothetical protein